MTALLLSPPAFAKVKISKLAKKLLYGDEATRVEAMKAFNKLPVDDQYELVPDFMVALTDDDPQVRKIASRILKAMGVKTEAQIPDVKNERPAPEPPEPAVEQLKEEKKLEQTELPATPKEMAAPPAKPAGGDQWADLENMREGQTNNYEI